ncbi:hypothetical protein [Escherichia coli]|uniref:hypothetical protein n=1 Tax=Escherichia coli TaxID=562 RepID=UPI001F24DB97|nr:hypothetical protein [Escherichia coli]
MKAKITDLFCDAMKYAIKGDTDITDEYLRSYENKMTDVSRKIDALKREYEQLNDEHTAICVIFGAGKK